MDQSKLTRTRSRLRGRRLIVAGCAVLVLLATALLAPAPAALAQKPRDLTEEQLKRAVGRDVREVPAGPQRGLLAVTLANGKELFTHGPDPAATTADSHGTTLGPGDPERPPVCSGEYFMHVLYAYPVGSANRLLTDPTVRPQLQSIIARMNHVLDEESRESAGKSADYKLLCDSSGKVQVHSFAVGLDHSFDGIVSAAQTAGATHAKADYVIFFDGRAPEQGLCGTGSVWRDERNSDANYNNNPGTVEPGYAVIWRDPQISGLNCWLDDTPMHEVGHTQGAVQAGAPNDTGALHCRDGIDVMCYADGGPNDSQVTRCTDHLHFDCNHDDYFDAAPEAGEYLANFWNIGSLRNRFIDFGPPGITLNQLSSPTSDRTPTFSGRAEPSAPVEVKINDADGTVLQTLKVTAHGTTGDYSATASPDLADGDYTAKATHTDAIGQTGSSEERSFTVSGPAPSDESEQTPSSTEVVKGSVVAGNASSLEADDDQYFSVKHRKRPIWLGNFSDVPDDLVSLEVVYRGKASRSCTQKLSIYNWRTSSYVSIDQRSVGTSEQDISVEVQGALADYVNGSGGTGDLRLRVECGGKLTLSGDLMKIVYGQS